MRLALALALAAFLPACLIPPLPPGEKPAVTLAVDAATQHNHRGMPQNATGVLQPSAAIEMPAIGDGLMSLSTWGNIDLQDDVGDAWYPDGNALRFSEIDYIASYSKFFGRTTTRFGIHSYNPPRGDRFPFGARGATLEIFGHAEYDLDGGWFPFAELRVDVDEAEGWYAFAGLAKTLPIDARWSAEVEGYASFMDSQQAFWNYGLTEAGFADARVTGKLFFQYDPATRFNVQLAVSSMIDQSYRDEFDDDDIDADNAWISAGVSWSY